MHSTSHNWAAQLRRFVTEDEAERCDLCAQVIPQQHAHLLEQATRRLVCACQGCALSLESSERFLPVPSRAEVLRDFELSDAEWDALAIPIGMVFVYLSTPLRRPVAIYPGAAGTTESLLSLQAWVQLVAANPVLNELTPDVEALLVNRTNGAREYYRVSIDRCYSLAGLIRMHWHGLSGGAEVEDAVRDYFAALRVALPRELLHMVDLRFAVQGIEVERHAVSPLLLFALRVTNATPALPVLNVMLNCQVRIEPARRAYGAAEHDRLSDLFGEPRRWGQTLQSFLWTHASVSVPAFEGECRVDLPVPCSYDFNVAATKYFQGLEDGEVPLNLLFSGSVFYRGSSGELQIGQIAWTSESGFRLPVAVWRDMMDHYYPQSAWLCLRRDAFEALYRYKRQEGLPTFEQALQRLLEAQETVPAPEVSP